MANTRKDSLDRLRKMRELHAKGASTRAIGEAIGVSRTTVSAWLARDARRSGTTPAAKSKASASKRTLKQNPPAAEVADLLTKVDAGAPLEVLRSRRRQIAHALDVNFGPTQTGAFSMSLYRELAKLETFYLAEEARLTPPEPPDPASDPNNIEAARLLERQLANLVEQAELESRCTHCGKPPFTNAG